MDTGYLNINTLTNYAQNIDSLMVKEDKLIPWLTASAPVVIIKVQYLDEDNLVVLYIKEDAQVR